MQKICLKELVIEKVALEEKIAWEKKTEAANWQSFAEQKTKLAVKKTLVLVLYTILQAR